MGLRLFCPDDTAPIPRPVSMAIRCDTCNAPQEAIFERGSYPELRQQARQAGWRFKVDGSVIGPCCAGPSR